MPQGTKGKKRLTDAIGTGPIRFAGQGFRFYRSSSGCTHLYGRNFLPLGQLDHANRRHLHEVHRQGCGAVCLIKGPVAPHKACRPC